jgi:hypothetical protein
MDLVASWRAWSGMAVLGCLILAALGGADHTTSPDTLEIILSSDRSSGRPGDTLHLKAGFVNHATKPFRIMELTQFLGDEFSVESTRGKPVDLEGGVLTYSPKVNLFTGTTRLVPAGQRITLEWEILIDHKLRLVFEERREEAPAYIDAAFRKRFDLPADYPAKFIGTGRIFPLPGPGRYRMRFVYDHAEAHGSWQLLPDPKENARVLSELWRGRAVSNVIEIEVRD